MDEDMGKGSKVPRKQDQKRALDGPSPDQARGLLTAKSLPVPQHREVPGLALRKELRTYIGKLV